MGLSDYIDPDEDTPEGRLFRLEEDHGKRRGDRANPHRGDCTGTLCPECGCCQHCLHSEDECPSRCRSRDCGCFGAR